MVVRTGPLQFVCLNLCCGAWCCVNVGNVRMIFGSGTSLNVQTSKFKPMINCHGRNNFLSFNESRRKKTQKFLQMNFSSVLLTEQTLRKLCVVDLVCVVECCVVWMVMEETNSPLDLEPVWPFRPVSSDANLVFYLFSWQMSFKL